MFQKSELSVTESENARIPSRYILQDEGVQHNSKI